MEKFINVIEFIKKILLQNFKNVQSIKIIISGRVQGVGFRYFVNEKANQLNIKGYVKNTFDGKVEVIAQGRKSDIEHLIKCCKVGSPLSIVKQTDYQDIPPIHHSVFNIKH